MVYDWNRLREGSARGRAAAWAWSFAGLSLALFSASPARADYVPLSASAGPVSAAVGDGLNGVFYNGGSSGFIGSIATANAIIAAGSPTATFMSTLVDYPRGITKVITDTTPLSTFLGPDAASLSGAGASTLDTVVFRFSGFIKITSDLDQVAGNATIDVNFAVGSDDGMRLLIGNVNIAQFDGVRAFAATGGVANFEGAGLYPIELLYFENHTPTGVEFYSSIAGNPTVNAPAGTVGIVPTTSLFTTVRSVPEPGSLMLCCLGAAGLVCARTRQRRGRTT